jgi:4-hydroxyphenylpyruvate dioxygenase-like putative hemolysin
MKSPILCRLFAAKNGLFEDCDAGDQRIALATNDIVHTVGMLREQGVEFL